MTQSADQTILVTGAAGYIARHVVRELLDRGYRVRGSMRDLGRAEGLREDLRQHLSDPDAATTRLEFVALDLNADQGWSEAMTGVSALIHTASPFPLAQPRDRDVLIRPAVQGTTRALTAAADAGVQRVVLTSSVAAIITQDPLHEARQRTGRNWTDPDHPATTAYGASKTLAERRAWEIAEERALHLTTVNPGMVLGPPIGGDYGSSVGVVKRILDARDPAMPHIMFDIVHVRDVARLHVDALTLAETIGERLVATGGAMWMTDMAAHLKDSFPGRRIPTARAPNWLLWIISLWDSAVRSIIPMPDAPLSCNPIRTEELTGMSFIDAREALTETAQWLIRRENA